MHEGLLAVVGDLQGIGEHALTGLEAVAALPAAEETETWPSRSANCAGVSTA